MKPVNEIINQVATNDFKASPEPRKASYSDDEKKQMDMTFSLLALEYPYFMPKSDDDLRRKRAMWIKLLRPYDTETRGKALEKTLKHMQNKGGPSVSEFMNFCKVPAAHKRLVQPALPAPSNLEKGKAALAAMLEQLKGKQ